MDAGAIKTGWDLVEYGGLIGLSFLFNCVLAGVVVQLYRRNILLSDRDEARAISLATTISEFRTSIDKLSERIHELR